VTDQILTLFRDRVSIDGHFSVALTTEPFLSKSQRLLINHYRIWFWYFCHYPLFALYDLK
jgi:hypothetical protein